MFRKFHYEEKGGRKKYRETLFIRSRMLKANQILMGELKRKENKVGKFLSLFYGYWFSLSELWGERKEIFITLGRRATRESTKKKSCKPNSS